MDLAYLHAHLAVPSKINVMIAAARVASQHSTVYPSLWIASTDAANKSDWVEILRLCSLQPTRGTGRSGEVGPDP